MEGWNCTYCGYVYLPRHGNPSQGILPGLEFSDIPPSWKCPICGRDRDSFELCNHSTI